MAKSGEGEGDGYAVRYFAAEMAGLPHPHFAAMDGAEREKTRKEVLPWFFPSFSGLSPRDQDDVVHGRCILRQHESGHIILDYGKVLG